MKSLKEKHLIALDTKDFYQTILQDKLSQLRLHQDYQFSSIWHFNQYEDLIKKEAKKLDEKEDKDKLPLFGLTFGAKDLFCVKDWKTTAGSKVLSEFVSPYTSTVVSRFESVGSLLAGKTSMDEFAMGSFTNTAYLGKTALPDFEDYTCGGSSGGSAAALKLELFDFTIGSDTGGSVRQPAAFCGLVGYKPSYGAMSRYGMITYASSLDQAGLFTHTVSDLKYLLQSIDTSKDDKDDTSIGIKKEVKEKSIQQTTVGYFPQLLEDVGLSESVKKKYKKLIDDIQLSGASIKAVDIPLLKQSSEIYYVIACAEASSNLARYQGVFFGHQLTEFAKEQKIAVDDYWQIVSKYRSHYLGQEVQKRILLGSYVLSSEKFDAIYQKATLLRKELTQQIQTVLGQCDYLVMPTFPTTTPKWSDIQKMTSAQIYLADFLTVGFSLAGVPVVTVPSDSKFDIETSTGFQFIGKKYDDMQLVHDVETIISKIKD